MVGKAKLILVMGLLGLFWYSNGYAESNGLVNIHKEYRSFKGYFKYDPKVLYLALEAYDCGVASGHDHNAGLLTIVDYSLPSTRKRLWVLDLNRHKLLYHSYVAHGVGSGDMDATSFSNIPNSFKSSLGLYETGRNYFGEWGYAMRLHGLDKGLNNNAYKRDIVMHGGKYVSQREIQEYGMIGMSHGCFVVPVTLDHRIINRLKGGSLVFAYYPNQRWLKDSKYLHCPIIKEMA